MGFLYPADEWYLLAGEPVPPVDDYDGFPQLENGIGLVRRLLEDWCVVKGSLASIRPAIPRQRRLSLICGTLIAPILVAIAGELSSLAGIGVEVIPIVNQFLGSTVTVSGLLTGQDVLHALRGRDLGDVVLLPGVMFDALRDRTLDEWTPDRLREQLGVPVWVARNMTEVVERLWRR